MCVFKCKCIHVYVYAYMCLSVYLIFSHIYVAKIVKANENMFKVSNQKKNDMQNLLKVSKKDHSMVRNLVMLILTDICQILLSILS